jgi:precorrin-2 methylase
VALAVGVQQVLAGDGERARRLPEILDIIESAGLMDRGIFASRAGMDGERVETDLGKLRGLAPEAGYLSIILVHAGKEEKK